MLSNVNKADEKDLKIYYDFLKKNEGEKIYELYPSSNITNVFDAIQTTALKTDPNNFTTSIIELKNRDITVDKYEDFLIDWYKVKNLQDIAKKTNFSTYLVALYSKSNKILIWEIDPNKDYKIETRKANNTTFIESGKRYKEVVMLPLSEATCHFYKFF